MPSPNEFSYPYLRLCLTFAKESKIQLFWHFNHEAIRIANVFSSKETKREEEKNEIIKENVTNEIDTLLSVWKIKKVLVPYWSGNNVRIMGAR